MVDNPADTANRNASHGTSCRKINGITWWLKHTPMQDKDIGRTIDAVILQ